MRGVLVNSDGGASSKGPVLALDAAPLDVAEALGWHGHLMIDADVLGEIVDIVYEWTGPQAIGNGGHSNDEARFHVLGVLVRRDSWRIARRAAAAVSALAPVAVLLGEADVTSQVAADAHRLGLGLVTTTPHARVVVPPSILKATARTRVRLQALDQLRRAAAQDLEFSGR